MANPGIINPQCSNLRIGQTLCLGVVSHQCYKVYTVKSRDYCVKIAKKIGISVQQLYAKNPNINPGCTNLKVDEVKIK